MTNANSTPERKPIRKKELLCYRALKRLSRRKKPGIPSLDDIAKAMGGAVKRTRVCQLLASLEQKGYIRRESWIRFL